jgi:competence ComEA-like helix-hairpin-helix protein
MGMLDRDYYKRPEEGPPELGHVLRNRWLWIGLAALVLLASLFALLAPAPSGPIEEGSRVVNINTASLKELESLPGIGPSLAELVVAGRPYRTVDDLERVKGIGPRQVENLRPLLTVSGDTRDLRPRSMFEQLFEGLSALNTVILGLIGCGLIAAGYALFVWIRRTALANQNRQVQQDFDEAERRRWEGHRRDKK